MHVGALPSMLLSHLLLCYFLPEKASSLLLLAGKGKLTCFQCRRVVSCLPIRVKELVIHS